MSGNADLEILLVEDSQDDVALTLRALAKHNLANRVLVARDGAEALEVVKRNGHPKVVLLDLKLPKVSGLQVLESFKRDPKLREIPVVIITSSREEPDIARAYALGVNSYIVKPVDFEGFVNAVAEAGLYWLVLNEPPRT